jgi:hypothetical protein
MIPNAKELEMRIVLLERQCEAMHKTIVAQADVIRKIVETISDLVPMNKRKWKPTDIVGEFEEE